MKIPIEGLRPSKRNALFCLSIQYSGLKQMSEMIYVLQHRAFVLCAWVFFSSFFSGFAWGFV